MIRTFHFAITSKESGMPIGFFLKSMGVSSSCLIQLRKAPGSILINHQPVLMKTPLHEDDLLTVILEEQKQSEHIPAVPLPLDIIYEDEDILVVNKPADMPIHPSMDNYENTLGNAVAYYFKDQMPFVYRCVNRLDRDTTGLTIVAKNQISAGILSQMISNRRVKREYLAISSKSTLPLEGIIDAPITRKEASVIERIVDFEYGEKAVTHYKKITSNESRNLSLLLLHLETGRTHQIRVHMKHIGAPLIGDYLYNPDMTYIQRQALHSYRLTLNHPITKEPMQFVAPVPIDMQNALGVPLPDIF
ncbi:MAG: RluA family pseudouridine synthase [Lachnospiraceae bacterium]|nr:RluA family pseudouridine synthase [Lachnospiraceae bacterium]